MPRCFGCVEVGAGQEDAEVAVVRARRPHLLTVHDPLVAVAHGPGREPGEVGAGARLAEELAPHLVAAQHRRQVALRLLVGAVGDDRRPGHARCRRRRRCTNSPSARRLLGEDRRPRSRVPPRPPYSFGQVMPAHPWSARYACHGFARATQSSVVARLRARTPARGLAVDDVRLLEPARGPRLGTADLLRALVEVHRRRVEHVLVRTDKAAPPTSVARLARTCFTRRHAFGGAQVVDRHGRQHRRRRHRAGTPKTRPTGGSTGAGRSACSPLVAFVDAVDRGILPGRPHPGAGRHRLQRHRRPGFLGTAFVLTGFLVMLPAGYLADRLPPHADHRRRAGARGA